jgi:archaellum component FlaC
LAVCLLACAFGVYKIERLSATHRKVARSTAQAALAELRAQKGSDDELIEKQTSELTRLRDESSERKQELDGLRSELHGFEGRSNELVEQNGKVEDSLRLASAQRDALGSKLRETEQAYQDLQSQISSLRAERDHAVAETASLEGRISELSAANHDQERTIREDEQFLASDRDIRELMGARKLYIADVFDVDSGSHTRKPFGRVFYTQNKSLIFYAFDLDRQPGFKDASTFQVWGQKDTAQGQIARPTDLGILYLDSATNRRWVLRLDDPRQLAQIDAVFVTVEPHGGSQKPTSKPFLYALLRKEANHP